MPKDYYSILGVSRDASADEIKKSYRKLSRDLHPDRHKGDKEKETKFKEVNEAYEVLSHPKKKQAYDQFGSADGNAFGAGGQGFEGFDPSQFSGNLGDIFASFFGGQRGGARSQTGSNIEISLSIPFMDAVTGSKREVTFDTLTACDECDGNGTAKGSKIIACTHCGGTGQVTHTTQSFFGTMQQTIVCPDCHGSGKVPEKKCSHCDGEGRTRGPKTVTVNVPAGIHDGQSLRLREDGQAGIQGQPAGDLYVHIQVEPDQRFVRDGDDIRTSLLISITDAVLGAKQPIETVHGPVTLRISAGTQPGDVLRIRSKGMPVLNSSKHGDHYVTIDVEIPKKLSRKERKLFEELQNF